MSKDLMGDKLKFYEMHEAGRTLIPLIPVMARLDGVAFHTFTRGLQRPYDERLSRCMIETTQYLVDYFHATVGYTQSDEISLCWKNDKIESEFMFGGRLQKLHSVIAARATAKFNERVREYLPEKAHWLPVFDCRVWNVPNLAIAAENFVWRELDATKNSVNMAASAYYSHTQLKGVPNRVKHDMLMEKGVNWNDYPAFFKRGVYMKRVVVERPLTDVELARIPAQYRPTGPVTKGEVQVLDWPPITRWANDRAEVLFNGAQPVAETR